MKGSAGKLGRINSYTILRPGENQLKKNIYTAVMDFMHSLRKINIKRPHKRLPVHKKRTKIDCGRSQYRRIQPNTPNK